jgi:CcmD family protein
MLNFITLFKTIKVNRKLLLTLTTICIMGAAYALPLLDVPPAPQVDMATGMRSNGKIYVVVAVLSMVLIGLFIYLFSLDRKISKLEKEK